MKGKFKEYIKEHKAETILVVTSLLGAGAAIAYGVITGTKRVDNVGDYSQLYESRYLDSPELDMGTFSCIDPRDSGYELIVNDFTVGDAGKLGEQLCKLEGVTPETELSLIADLIFEEK